MRTSHSPHTHTQGTGFSSARTRSGRSESTVLVPLSAEKIYICALAPSMYICIRTGARWVGAPHGWCLGLRYKYSCFLEVLLEYSVRVTPRVLRYPQIHLRSFWSSSPIIRPSSDLEENVSYRPGDPRYHISFSVAAAKHTTRPVSPSAVTRSP